MAESLVLRPEPAIVPRRRDPSPAGVRERRTAIRPEIQALRAVAVMLVVLYHLWPSAVPGGYIGVDVFFAISGFLITSHLVREVGGSGRVGLTRFWARRARRLLPASLATLLFCVVATAVWVPEIYWRPFLDDVRASTLYVQNWHLAASSVDYLAAADRASPVQHFWSLSAEEQFYLVWPLLIGLALAVAGRRSQTVAMGPRRSARLRRRAVATALGGVTLASLVFSIVDTAGDPERAYFVTPTRAWEFGVGGLLALAAGAGRRGDTGRSVMSWLGLAAIAVAAFAYSGATAFPGYAALLPVLGTLLVIAAGAPGGRGAPTAVFRLRGVQGLGDISYSLYLWHWPLLILAPFVLAHPLTDPMRAGILSSAIAIAWLSKRYVEDPARRSAWLQRGGSRRTFALAGAAMLLLVGLTVAGVSRVDASLDKAQTRTARVLKAPPRCFGAASHDPARPCVNPRLARTVLPSTLEVKNEGNSRCVGKSRVGLVSLCHFGVAPERARRTVALLGDSHSTMWRAGLETVAQRERWHGLSVNRTGCPYSLAVYDLPEPARSDCVKWVAEVPARLAAHPEADTVFVANITGGKVVVPAGMTMEQAKIDGYQRAWAALPPTIKRIVVLRDTPKAHNDTLECIDEAIAAGRAPGRACAVQAGTSLYRDPAAIAAAGVGAPRAAVIDLTRYVCEPSGRCDTVIGGAVVYKDANHLSRVYSESLGPYLLTAIRRLEPGWS